MNWTWEFNHVTRTWTCVVPRTSNIVVTLPGGADGPSGVFVGSEDFISYYSNVEDSLVVLRLKSLILLYYRRMSLPFILYF